MHTVLFLCTGNYYRSRYAEIVFNWLARRQGLTWQADSRGLAIDARNPGPMSIFTREAIGRLQIACASSTRSPIPVTRADLVAYAEASGDHNPIHQDEEVALSVGLPGVIAHGMYTMALAARAVADWYPGAELVSIGCKFTNPVVVPAEGAVEVEVAGEAKGSEDGLTTIALTVTSGGQKVLGMPKAVVRTPADD